MHRLWVEWGRFVWWVDHLSAREAAMFGAVSILLIGGIGKYFVVPFLIWGLKRVGALLYPLVSGALIFNRLVGLPRYFKSIQTTVGRLRNPWLSEGQELREIFVPVSVNRGVGSNERWEVRALLNSVRAAVILGDPGSGKTTALKAIAMNCRQKWRARRSSYIPVYIQLRAWGLAGSSLTKHVEDVFRENDFPNAARFIKKLMRNGKLVFLLDALDEVDEANKAFVVREVRALLKEQAHENGCAVYITSRPVGYDGQFIDLIQDTAFMEDFTPVQIQKFIDNWDFRPPKTGGKLFQALLSRPPILLICRNPLMLTIVTSLYRETDYQLPDSRDAFYKICIQALLTRWDAARELQDRNRYPEGLKEAFLQDLAFAYLSQRTKELSSSGVLEQVELFLANRKRTDIKAEEFLHEIVRSGLLGKLPTGELYFAHKTLAEALAALRFRNRPEELMKLWQSSPDAWQEVCCLYVSDSLTSVSDIAVVLDRAISTRAWSSVIVLAGEAHTVSENRRQFLVERLQNERALWPNLDKRTMAALARFGDVARPILTQMFGEPSVELRRLAIYALGQCREDWALELLIRALTDPATRTSAAESLAGLGEDAVVLIEDLLRTSSGSPELARACIEIAGTIGTASAVRVIMPLLWGDSAPFAAQVIMRLLSIAEVRNAVESEDLNLPVPGGKAPGGFEKWAFPWLPDTARILRSYYAQLLTVLLAAYITEALFPPDFLIPFLIASRSRGHLSFVSDVTPTIQPVLDELRKRSDEKNRALWSRVSGEDRRDIVLSERVSLTIWNAATGVLLGIMLWGAWNHWLSWWWFLAPAAVAGVFLLLAKYDQDPSVLLFFGASVSCPSFFFTSQNRNHRVVYAILSLYDICLVVAATLALTRGGGPWLLVLLGVIPSCLPTETDPQFRIVLRRRSNPLRRLRMSLLQKTNTAAAPSSPALKDKILGRSTAA